MYEQEENDSTPGKQSLLIGFFLNIACALGIGFAAVRVAPPKPPWNQLMHIRAAAFILLMIAAIYFFQRGVRLVIRFQSERAAEYYARTAPKGLGLNATPPDHDEQAHDREI